MFKTSYITSDIKQGTEENTGYACFCVFVNMYKRKYEKENQLSNRGGAEWSERSQGQKIFLTVSFEHVYLLYLNSVSKQDNP